MSENPDARIVFAIPGDIQQRSGGYGYARAVMTEWRAAGVEFRHLELPGGFPFPTSAELEETARRLSELASQSRLLVDGLAYGAFPPDIISRLPAAPVVLLHHPLGLETGLAQDQAKRMIKTERQAVQSARHVIVTSTATARTVAELFDLKPSRITIALPGTQPKPRAERSGDPPVILSVGSLTPRKGHRDLVAALHDLRDLDWRAHFAGSVEASPETVVALKKQIERSGLEDRIVIEGALGDDRLDALYRTSTIFALASYYEGYGMAFAEAMSAGLPVVGYRAGAVGDVVPSQAGVLVGPGDVEGLSNALRRLLVDRKHADRLAEGAARAGLQLPAWRDTARRIADIMSGPGV